MPYDSYCTSTKNFPCHCSCIFRATCRYYRFLTVLKERVVDVIESTTCHRIPRCRMLLAESPKVLEAISFSCYFQSERATGFWSYFYRKSLIEQTTYCILTGTNMFHMFLVVFSQTSGYISTDSGCRRPPAALPQKV